jgi:hypothetical protein
VDSGYQFPAYSEVPPRVRAEEKASFVDEDDLAADVDPEAVAVLEEEARLHREALILGEEARLREEEERLAHDQEEAVLSEQLGARVSRPRRANAGVPAVRYDDEPRFQLATVDAYEAIQQENQGDVYRDIFLLSFGARSGAGVPRSYRQARESPDWPHWKRAMEAELDVIGESKTFTLEPRRGQHVLPSMWVFTVKTDANGQVARYKARLVVCGNKQIAGLEFDYARLYSPVVRTTSLRIFFAVAAALGLPVFQIDVVGAFLHAALQEKIFMKQPVGFEEKGKEDWVWRLWRSLYGLRQAPYEFNLELHGILLKNGFKQAVSDPCLYFLMGGDFGPGLLIVHVDDQCFAGTGACYDWLKRVLSVRFKIDDRGLAKQVVGLDVLQTERGIFLSQEQYVRVLLEREAMARANPVSTPLEVRGVPLGEPLTLAEAGKVRASSGALMWLAVNTRLDIGEAVRELSRMVQAPTTGAQARVKRILRYLVGTQDWGIFYSRGVPRTAAGWFGSFCDASGPNDPDRRSATGYVALLCGAPVDWMARTQKLVSLDLCGAEYVACSESLREAVWCFRLLVEVLACVAPSVELEESFVLRTDNQPAIKVASDRRVYRGTKHLEVKYHYVRQMVEEGMVRLEYVPTVDNLADILTKPLGRSVFQRLRAGLLTRVPL